MKKGLKSIVPLAIALSLFLFVDDIKAQGPPGGGGSPGQGGCVPPPCVPIDGGLSILLAAGAAFGGKKIYENLKD